MTNHTPGPWHIEHEYNVMNTNGYSVASCGGYQRTSIGDEGHLEKIANACLIAAAPDMLEVCKKSLRILLQYPSEHGEIKEELYQVIRKARGEL